MALIRLNVCSVTAMDPRSVIKDFVPNDLYRSDFTRIHKAWEPEKLSIIILLAFIMWAGTPSVIHAQESRYLIPIPTGSLSAADPTHYPGKPSSFHWSGSVVIDDHATSVDVGPWIFEFGGMRGEWLAITVKTANGASATKVLVDTDNGIFGGWGPFIAPFDGGAISIDIDASVRVGSYGYVNLSGVLVEGTARPGCTFAISPTFDSFTTDGGSDVINVFASDASCSWSFSSPVPWITFDSNASRAGSGTVGISVAPNATPARTVTLTIADLPLTISIAPLAPTNLRATQIGNSGTQIQLTWDYGSDPIDGFRIERKPPSGDWAAITGPQPGPGDRSYTDAVSPFNTYTYRIRAYKGASESSNSDEKTCFQILLYTEANDSQMASSFQPDAHDLGLAAGAFGFDHFNWVSYLTQAAATALLVDANFQVINHPPPSVLDPPFGGWWYLAADYLPYYWNETPGLPAGYSLGSHTLPTSVTFRDRPSSPPFEHQEFKTLLVGVKDPIGTLHKGSTALAAFTWSSNFNAFFNTGGITDYVRMYNLEPPVTSGTGGVFNAQVIDKNDLPLEVRMALMEAGVDGVSAEPKVDKDAPTTAAFPSGSQGTNGWYKGPVTVSLIATDIDGPTDIAATYYKIDGGVTQTYTGAFAVSGDGLHTISFGSTDKAGNVETPPRTETFKIDGSLPVVSGLPAPASTLWPPNNKLVQVATVTATDALSGLASLSVTVSSNEPFDPKSPDIVITGSGLGARVVQLRAQRLGTGSGRVYTITATATDLAGNTRTVTMTVVVPHDQGK